MSFLKKRYYKQYFKKKQQLNVELGIAHIY